MDQNVSSPMAPKERFSRLGLGLVVLLAASLLGQILAIGVMMVIVPEKAMDLLTSETALWLLSFLPMYCLAFPAGFLVLRTVPGDRMARTPLERGGFWKYLLLCFPIMVGGNLLGTWLAQAFSTGSAENPLLDFAYSTNLLKVLFMVILAPVLEELIFRKCLVDRAAAYGERSAVLFSALCFGMFHMNLYQFFYAFGIGVIFAYVYLRTRDLRYTIGMHMIINFLGGVVAPWLTARMQEVDPTLLEDPERLLNLLHGSDPAARQILGWVAAYGLYTLLYLGAAIAGLVLLILNWGKARFRPDPEGWTGKLRRRAIYGNVGVILFLVLSGIMTLVTLFVA